jgi:pimeloyl-ACP methyl ester carboxylesterase
MGDFQGVQARDCESAALEQGILDQRGNAHAQQSFIHDFFARCGAQLRKGSKPSLLQLVDDMNMNYDYWKLSNVKTIDVPGFGDLKIHAQLLLKDENQARPMVIVQCGLQCDFNNNSLKPMVMHLFDEAPFNLLLLPSYTSPTFQKENHVFTVGGFDEGRKIMYVAKWLQSDAFAYRKLVSSVHLVGISLGGHAALYAAIYNSYDAMPDGTPYIKTIVVGCPAIDLEKSIRNLYKKGFVGKHLFQAFWKQIRDVLSFVPDTVRAIARRQGDNPRLEDTPDVIGEAAVAYYAQETQKDGWDLAPFQDVRIQSEAELWKYNRFQDFAQLVKHPVFIWSSDNDCVVSPEANSHVLIKKFRNDPDSQFNILLTERGGHCDFGPTYGWRTAGTYLRALILSNSPDLLERRTIHTARLEYLSFPREAHMSAFKKRAGIMWQAVAGDRNLRIINTTLNKCAKRKTTRKDKCYNRRISTVDIGNVGLSANDIPKSEVQADVLTRWLNANVWFYGQTPGRLNPREDAQQIEWVTY